MILSDQQAEACRAVQAWHRGHQAGIEPRPFFYLGGFAGSGKTTIAREIAQSLPGDGKVYFGAFTGKAALVLRSKGCEGASTIHSMIYKADRDTYGRPTFYLDTDAAVADAKLIVIDECSMVSEELGTDLLSFGRPVLVLGDPAQLPPVKGEGFFTAGAPDFMLTEIHRQAAENPIIRMSMEIREGGRLQYGTYGDSRVVQKVFPDDALAADQILVGLNRTRTTKNARYRALKGIQGFWPVKGERLVCLKNSKKKGLLNGSLWQVKRVTGGTEDAVDMAVTALDFGMTETPVDVTVHRAFFEGEERRLDWRVRKDFDEFDFGYALTVHKSQGSQWDHVLLFDEGGAFRDDAIRWRYTAITRAAERITVVI